VFVHLVQKQNDLLFSELFSLKVSLVINVNIPLMNANLVHVQNIVIVLIYQIVIHVFVVGGLNSKEIVDLNI
jgi:hypothetical protein